MFNTNISQPKIDKNNKSLERERERENIRIFLVPNMDWMEERTTKFYSKKNGRRRVKIKGRWRGGRMVSLMYKVEGDRKSVV